MTDNTMQELYKRLRKVGFDPGFLRQSVLPDWWEDSLSGVPANRAFAEVAISRHLGLTLSSLRQAGVNLKLPDLAGVRLKKNKNIQVSEVAPAITVARHAAKLTAENLTNLPPFGGRLTATEVRKAVLKGH